MVTGAKFVGTLKVIPLTPTVIPLTPTASEIEMRLFGKPLLDEAPDHGQYYEDAGSSEDTDLNGEDIDLCERVQEGMLSEYGGVGALAREYDQSIKHFHDKYLSELSM